MYLFALIFFAEGYTDTVSALLTAKEIDVTMQNGFGKTALALAAELNTKNNKAVVELLNNDNPYDREDREYMPNNELEKKSMMERRNKTKANYLEKRKKTEKNGGFSPSTSYSVLKVIKNMKNETVIEAPMPYGTKKEKHIMLPLKVIPPGIDPCCNESSKTKLHCKTCYRCENCASKPSLCLSLRGIEDHSKTSLFLACEEDHSDVVAYLLSVGETEDINVNAMDNAGRTTLTVAAVEGFEQVVKLLLEYPGMPPIDVNKGQQADSMTGLMLATEGGHEGVV